jgi:hypothetical protein
MSSSLRCNLEEVLGEVSRVADLDMASHRGGTEPPTDRGARGRRQLTKDFGAAAN